MNIRPAAFLGGRIMDRRSLSKAHDAWRSSMAWQLVSSEDTYMPKTGVVSHEAVIGHLRQVSDAFAAKPAYRKFHIGVTRDLTARLAAHRAGKPDCKWMCPIYPEAHNLVGNAVDRLERKAIEIFRGGIAHPRTHETLLACSNGPGGALPKNRLCILVG
ncbi:GIY-YIG nuclease family protein [Burkholderia sp. MSh2]|nr:GIY-YIG nuclease family protein [Burkholderia sp. MSh2]